MSSPVGDGLDADLAAGGSPLDVVVATVFARGMSLACVRVTCLGAVV